MNNIESLSKQPYKGTADIPFRYASPRVSLWDLEKGCKKIRL